MIDLKFESFRSYVPIMFLCKLLLLRHWLHHYHQCLAFSSENNQNMTDLICINI